MAYAHTHTHSHSSLSVCTKCPYVYTWRLLVIPQQVPNIWSLKSSEQMSLLRMKAIPRKPILPCVLRGVPLWEAHEWPLVFLLRGEAKEKLQRKISRSKRNCKKKKKDVYDCLQTKLKKKTNVVTMCQKKDMLSFLANLSWQTNAKKALVYQAWGCGCFFFFNWNFNYLQL